MTISSVFIRRPRLAFVISTVITLAGIIALGALPVAQFPDIVPPQVKVTTFYPGASGLVVQLRLADDSIYSEKGKLDFIDVTVDSKTDGQVVRALFPNKNETLTDGMTVRVILEAEKPPTVIAISQAAVALDQSGSYVFVVNDKNVVEQRRVKTGPVRDGLMAIDSGLKAGDKVIIQGQQKVRPGMTVAPSQAPARPKQ